MRPEHIVGKRVLYGCLDWGYGHFARSIPLLIQLQEQGNKVVFLGTEDQFEILRSYGFSGEFAQLSSTGFRFRGDGNFKGEAFRNMGILRKAIQRDRKRLSELVGDFSPQLIISDHRYGLRFKGISSVFVTHQTSLPPGSGWLANRIHRLWMKRFDTIWIMDDREQSLAGKLSSPVPDSEYIGWYSRFQQQKKVETVPGRIVAIISGPEPYATQFLEAVAAYSLKRAGEWYFITANEKIKLPEHVKRVTDWTRADELIGSAELLISRCGYTTLMDLKILNTNAVLVPTPGQLEQLYLRDLHSENPSWQWGDIE
jgi:UDP:flavonoid glycosyltransferase YjiC (YdhE family)